MANLVRSASPAGTSIKNVDTQTSHEKVYKSHTVRREMRKRAGLLAVVFFGSGLFYSAGAQKGHEVPRRLLTAKLVYFENQTGFPAVGGDAIREIQEW